MNTSRLVEASLQHPPAWEDVILHAVAEKVDFCDVHIITLRAHCKELLGPWPTDNQITARQFIEYDGESNLTLCVDIDHIDDEVTFWALNVLYGLISTYGLEVGKREFGEPITFLASDVEKPTSDVYDIADN